MKWQRLKRFGQCIYSICRIRLEGKSTELNAADNPSKIRAEKCPLELTIRQSLVTDKSRMGSEGLGRASRSNCRSFVEESGKWSSCWQLH